MNRIIHARIILPDEIIEDGSILFDGKIRAVSRDSEADDADTVIEADDADTVIDAEGATVIPGLIDLHIHGYNGFDVSDGNTNGVIKMAEDIAKNGVTAFLPTTMTLSYGELNTAFDSVREAMASGTESGAEILGIHAEGPFINPERCGAQPKEYSVPPDADFVIKNKDVIRIITVAPEMDEDLKAIKRIKAETDVVVSFGHTTADYETVSKSIAAGVSHATHLFNAMTGLNHRQPGAVGAALSSPAVSCELICDTFHINPAIFPIVSAAKGDKLVLITDSMRANGLPDGTYTLGGQEVCVCGIRCQLPNGTIAGSVLKLNHAVNNAVKSGISVNAAVNAASLNPARVLGLDGERGSLEVGKRADIVICDREFNVKTVFRAGKQL